MNQESLFREQANLRYAALREKNWNVSYCDRRKIEWDEYDTSKASYFMWRESPDLQPLACLRIIPTGIRFGRKTTFLLKDHFSHKLLTPKLEEGPGFWEGTRFCISPHLAQPQFKSLRRQIVDELFLDILEYLVANNIRGLYGVMPNIVFQKTYERLGYPVTWLSDDFVVEGEKCRLALKETTADVLKLVRSRIQSTKNS